MTRFQLSAFADEASPQLHEQVQACRENGIGGIEIRGVGGQSVADLTTEQAREARKMVEDAGLYITAMGSPFGKIQITEAFEPHLDKFKRGVELCHELGTERMRIFSFYMPEGSDPNIYTHQVMDRLDTMLQIAQDANIHCAHENEKGIYGDTDERCLSLAKTFDGRMGAILDPANYVQCGVRPMAALTKLMPYLSWLHIKDALFQDGSIVPAGKGDAEIESVLQALANFSGTLTLTLEPHLTVFDGLASLQGEGLTHHYHYPDNITAFAAAAQALKQVLTDIKFTEGEKGIWTR